jgi:hypothetical protein
MKNLFLLLLFSPIAILAQIKVHSTGNVSLGGETTPRSVLDINKNTTNTATAQFGSFAVQSFGNTNGFISNNGFWNGSAMQSYVNGGVPLLQFFDGGVLFRTTPVIGAGATTLDFSNNIHCIKDPVLGGIVGINTFNPSGFNLQVTGDAFKSSGGSSWSIPSDERLKENIAEFKDGLDIILNMRTVQYEYNGKAGTIKGEKSIGIIAQEIKKLAPYMIREFEFSKVPQNGMTFEIENATKERYLSYNDSSLPYILVNAIQDQQKIIENQEAQIEFLEEKINGLVSSIESIQKLFLNESNLALKN